MKIDRRRRGGSKNAKHQHRVVRRAFYLFLGLLPACEDPYPPSTPLGFPETYPASDEVQTIEFLERTLTHRAPGSDNWPMTWAADGLQYTSWGDGGGFGGTNSQGRVSLGVAAIEGSSEAFAAKNLFGSPMNSEAPATFGGKSYGMIALGDTLYMWVSPGSTVENLQRAVLHQSLDGGRTWTETEVSFYGENDQLGYPTFLQAGQDNSLSPSGHVYIYATRVWDEEVYAIQQPGEVVLMRALRGQLHDPDRYEYFGGPNDGTPTWESDLSRAEPVFIDPNGALRISVALIPALDRYFLFTDHTETHAGNLAIFESPTPWGPWSLVERWYNWSVGGLSPTTFFWNVAPAWIANDGSRFTLVFSGTGEADGWNSVDAVISLLGTDEN